MAATAKDLSDFRAAGAASSTSSEEVDRVWRMFAAGFYSKSTALQLLGSAPETTASTPAEPVSAPAASLPPSKSTGSVPNAKSASPEDRLASEIVALFLGNSQIAAPVSAEDKLSAAIVHSFHTAQGAQ